MLKNMILRDGGAVDEFPLLGMKFFYLDLTGLVLFCVFLGLAIKAARRRDIALHLRLIACTAIIPLEAAIVVLAVLVAGEWWYGRSRWPLGALLAYYLIMMFTTDVIARAEWFQSAAFRFANI